MGYPLGAVQLIIVGFVFTAMAAIAVALRIWSRRIQGAPLAFNDYMAILALIITAAGIGTDLISVFAGGVGHHLIDVVLDDPNKLWLTLKIVVAATIFWAASNTAMKISMLSLYMVLFPGRKFHLLCYGVMVLSMLYLISQIVLAFVWCTPIQYNWDKLIKGTCNLDGQLTGYTVTGSINLGIDVIIVALPISKLFGLKMKLAKKLGVASMFSLGALICIVSLLRVVAIANWDLSDITYTAIPPLIYSFVEPTLGIVNGCLPTLRPAILAIMGKSPDKANSSSMGHSSGKQGSSYNHSSSKGSKALSSRRRQQGSQDIPLTDFDNDGDDFALSSLVEGGHGIAPVKGQHPREITVEHGWEINVDKK